MLVRLLAMLGMPDACIGKCATERSHHVPPFAEWLCLVPRNLLAAKKQQSTWQFPALRKMRERIETGARALHVFFVFSRKTARFCGWPERQAHSIVCLWIRHGRVHVCAPRVCVTPQHDSENARARAAGGHTGFVCVIRIDASGNCYFVFIFLPHASGCSERASISVSMSSGELQIV